MNAALAGDVFTLQAGGGGCYRYLPIGSTRIAQAIILAFTALVFLALFRLRRRPDAKRA